MYNADQYEKEDETRPVITELQVKIGDDIYKVVQLPRDHRECSEKCALREICDANEHWANFCGEFIPAGYVFKKQ